MTIIRTAAAAAARALGIAKANRGPVSGSYVQPLEIIPGMTRAAEIGPLAKTWTEEDHHARSIGQVKIDGMRAFHIQSRIISREAIPLDCALHCLPALATLEAMYGQPMVFDGEYQSPEGFQATLAEHKRGEGCGTFHVFDAVPYSEWKRNEFTERLDARVCRLVDYADKVDSLFLEPVPPFPINDAAEAWGFAEGIWSRGGEGIVAKRANSLYTRGRTSDWLKIKRNETMDGVITDMVVVDGRVKTLLVRLPEGKVHKISAGIPENVRREIALTAQMSVGLVCEIGFNERTDTGMLRGGYFVRMRPDKGAL